MDKFIVTLSVDVEAHDADDAEDLVRELLEGDPLIVDYSIEKVEKETKVG